MIYIYIYIHIYIYRAPGAAPAAPSALRNDKKKKNNDDDNSSSNNKKKKKLHAMPRHATPRHATPCHAMPCYYEPVQSSAFNVATVCFKARSGSRRTVDIMCVVTAVATRSTRAYSIIVSSTMNIVGYYHRY